MTLDRAKHLCYNAFVPHDGNAYRPHMLHPRRTMRYAAAFAVMKLLVVVVAIALPNAMFASAEASNALLGHLLAATNAFRTSVNVVGFHADPRLARSATAKADDMVTQSYFAHQSPDGRATEDFLRDAGYPYLVAGENLAMGSVDASAILAAWAASPTHRRNLVDADFADVGFGVERGVLEDIPTLFVVQHLGKTAPSVSPGSVAVSKQPSFATGAQRSRIAWQPRGEGTQLTATVHVDRAVEAASVEVRGYDIPLTPHTDDATTLTGSATIPLAPDELFRVVTPATVTVHGDTATTTAPIAWDSPLRPAMTLFDRYAAARTLLPQTFGPLLATSRAIMLAALLLFAIAWVINLFVEIRHQHLDLIVPGGALVLLLVFFVIV